MDATLGMETKTNLIYCSFNLCTLIKAISFPPRWWRNVSRAPRLGSVICGRIARDGRVPVTLFAALIGGAVALGWSLMSMGSVHQKKLNGAARCMGKPSRKNKLK